MQTYLCYTFYYKNKVKSAAQLFQGDIVNRAKSPDLIWLVLNYVEIGYAIIRVHCHFQRELQ